MTCPSCRSARLVVIEFVVAGDDVRMLSCPVCDTRWWQRNGEAFDLNGVLALASERE
jgi:hypothetical protein